MIDLAAPGEPCSCAECRALCQTPCWGTPAEMRAIESAGFARRLEWVTARHEGSHLPTAVVLAPRLEHGACTFYGAAGCELHALGLKPVEGRLALCRGRSTPGVRLEVARAWSAIRHLP